MSKVTCTRRLHFSAGHRVYGHENKCANLHGHNYFVLLTAEGEELDSIGRVIDFSVLKDKVGAWIDTFWDHGFIFWTNDLECRALFDQMEQFINTKSYRLPMNPTAENLAGFLLYIVGPECLKDTNVRLTRVVIEETENCSAEASL